MERRELLGLMGASAVGLVTTGTALGGVVGQDEPEKHHEHHDPKHDEHLRVMVACIGACNETAHHCLEHLASDKTEHREYHARIHELTMDCQAICALAATMMARHSPLANTMYEACAKACGICDNGVRKESKRDHEELRPEVPRMREDLP